MTEITENVAATEQPTTENKGKTPSAARKSRKAPKATKRAKTAKKTAKPARDGGRREQLLALLSRKGGARLTEIMKAFKWQAHSCRGAVSILGQDHNIESAKVDGDRVYRIVK